eukprot:5612148-Prymnesium_polylepis.1
MAEAIKSEMGESTQVNHKVGCFLTSVSGGGRKEQAPWAMIVPWSKSMGVSAQPTGQCAKSLVGGAPGFADSTVR